MLLLFFKKQSCERTAFPQRRPTHKDTCTAPMLQKSQYNEAKIPYVKLLIRNQRNMM